MLDMALLAEIDTIAHWVRYYRKLKNWSQARLAEEAGVTQPGISDLERGNGDPQVSTVAKVAKALGIPTTVLLAQVEENAVGSA